MIVRADRRWLVRSLLRVALVPAAALLVHQLRFMLAFGSGAGAELARQGHSYLHSLVPWIVLLIGVAVGGFLWALGRALRGQRSVPRYTLSLAALWLVCCGFAGRDLRRAGVSRGSVRDGPSGWAGRDLRVWRLVVDPGGGVCRSRARRALARRSLGARRGGASVGAGVVPVARPRPARLPRPRDVWLPRLSPLADGWSGRGPPR